MNNDGGYISPYMATPATQEPPAGGPTPPRDASTTMSHAPYVPHDLKYSAEFEDSLINAVLEPDEHGAIRVIPDDRNEQPREGHSVRAAEISAQSLPSITEQELPLSLTDPRRIYASPIPGVKLTHPGGYLEGGPGLDPEMDTFPDDFLSNNADLNTPEELRTAVASDIEDAVQKLKQRLVARRKAKEKNEQLEKELKVLEDQHAMELRLQSRMAEEQRKKREAKEKRRRGKENS